MALPDSSLYLACNAVADTIGNGIQANTNNIKIYIGAPADITTKTDENRLNLFFYRFEPSGFQANSHPNDPWRLRMFCLVTCMTEVSDDQGKEDLKLLGMVMSFLHETPILPTITIGPETLRLQALFTPASDEQLNQIWATQGDATFRPSVIYEIALAPVMPENLRGEPPRVGFTGLETVADMNRRYDPFGGKVYNPKVATQEVSQTNPAWAPLICWVDGGECKTSLAVDVDIVDPTTLTPTLWIAGRTGESVDLEWQLWEEEEWTTQTGVSLIITSTEINPDNIPVGLPVVSLPPLTIVGQDRWQLLLFAKRNYQAYSGGPIIEIRSNPLLISFYRGTTP